jgi:N-acetylneuraminate lyase
MHSLSGILPAIVTPLDASGELNTKSFESLIAHFYEQGVDGLYICGNTGEGMQLPADVREKATEAAIRNSPAGKQVIVHVGAYRQDEAIRLARHASRLGAAAVSSLPPGPSYNFAETKTWYEAIAKESSVPFLVYHFPALSQPMSLDQLESLCHIPGVVGLKFTSFDLFSLRQLVTAGHVIFNGHDEVLAPGLLMGAHGGIGSTYNLMADLFVALNRQASAGQWTDAIATQDRINLRIRTLLRFPLIPAIKQVLTWRGIDCGFAVEPRAGLTSEQQTELRARMESTWT